MDLRHLVTRFAGDGVLQAIVLRPGRELPAHAVERARAIPGRGLDGDRSALRARRPGGSKREVTLLQAEHLPLIAAWLRRDAIDPLLLRRNLIVAGLNLLSARSPWRDTPVVLHIGEAVVLEITGPCDPCSKMERDLGPGAYNVLRGHGGVTARVLVEGMITVGDRVWLATGNGQVEPSPSG